MSSRDGEPQLAPDEHALARTLWEALMFAPSSSHLDTARASLKAASHSVQEAVMNAIVPLIAQNKEPNIEENPFS